MGNGGAGRDLQITKIGTGVQTFNGICSNTAPTYVGGGTLIINNSYTSPVTVSNSATLGGVGTLSAAVTIQSGGTLAPGTNLIGSLTINNNLTLNGNLFIKVDKSQPGQTNDYVVVSGALTNAGTGTLMLTNLSSNPVYACTNGDYYKLFSQAVSNGASLTVTSTPTLGAGLKWINHLAEDGSVSVGLSVANNPTNLTFLVIGGTNLSLSWPADHQGWYLQTQTNLLTIGLTTNLSDWHNVPGAEAGHATNFIINSTSPAVFYRLKMP